MRKSILALLILVFVSCANNKTNSEQSASILSDEKKPVEYKKLSNVFYKGSDGGIYIKTRSLIKPPEEEGPPFYRKVPVENYESYEDISGYYAKDKFNVYRDWSTTDGRFIAIIEEADVETFSEIEYRLGMDKSHVFYNGKIVDGIDVYSLEILCSNPNTDFLSSFGLYKDSRNVYYNKWKMETIDVASFECISKDSVIIYQDKNWVYKDDYFPDMDSSKRTRRE